MKNLMQLLCGTLIFGYAAQVLSVAQGADVQGTYTANPEYVERLRAYEQAKRSAEEFKERENQLPQDKKSAANANEMYRYLKRKEREAKNALDSTPAVAPGRNSDDSDEGDASNNGDNSRSQQEFRQRWERIMKTVEENNKR